MSESGRFTNAKSRIKKKFGFMSPQASSRNSMVQSPQLTSYGSNSTLSSKHLRSFRTDLMKVSRMPINEMFRKTVTTHSGTILPEHLYHPPRSSACMVRSPSYSLNKTSNKSFINVVEEHSKRIPSPTDYEKNLNWLNNTARDLSK